MQSIVSNDFCDGKYTVIFNETTGELKALRYGEEWRNLDGDGLVLAMLQEVSRLASVVNEGVSNLYKQ